jgi:GTP-binding nuclear protein Ran
LFSEPTLSLVEAPVLAPGEVEIDQQQIAQMQQELDAAQNMEIPDDDDF